jgi:hypothetical protein
MSSFIFCVLSGTEPYKHLPIGNDFDLVCFRWRKNAAREDDAESIVANELNSV